MNKKHDAAIAKIASEIRKYYKNKKPFHIFHGSTNSTRILSFKRDEMVDISKLNHILSIDSERHTAIVEPNVPMDKLVASTIKHGLVPPVVMEFPGITVGGGIQGGAGESSSFRWGCFNRIFNWYEMVLADGSIVKASPDTRADLFYGTAGSYGSLGVITAAEIQLVPAKQYVQLTYTPVAGFASAIELIEKMSKMDYDFVDGIMFGSDHGVIMCGKMTHDTTGKLSRFSRSFDPWFYLHAEKIDHQKRISTETIPLTDYLFRYDRGGFWVGKYAFELFDFPFNGFTRWLLNPILHTRKLYQALQESGASQQHIVQDLALPVDQAEGFMMFIDESLGVYPLWLCPLKPDKESQLQSNNLDTPIVINVGVWGSRIESYEKFIDANRLIETKLRELGGKKWFYAHSYYTENEFWKIYDEGWYKALRTKYHATSLPNIFDKIRVKDRYEINAKRGLYKTIFGRAKLKMKD